MCHIQLNYAFVLFFLILGKIHSKLFFFVKKVTKKEAQNYSENLFFSTSLKIGKAKKRLFFKQLFFLSKLYKGTILTKTVILFKVSHIKLSYVFISFEAFLGKFTGIFSFWSKKWLSEIEAQKYSESLFFSTSLKRSKSRRKFVFLNNYFSSN